MKMKKIFVILVVLFILPSMLFACNAGDVQDTATVSAQLTSEKIDEDGQQTDGPFSKYEPPIEISFVRTLDEDTSSNILPRTPGETLENNRWLTAYYEKLGISISYNWIVKGGYDSDPYIQKLNVAIASGDLPDIISVGPTHLKQLVDSDMLQDLTPYWDTYASDMLKSFYTSQGKAILGSSTFDGKLRALTSFADGYNDGIFIWIRADWLRKLDLDPPETMDDLLNIAEAFTEKDPDGNGIDDTYGFAVTKDLHSGVLGLEGFFSGFHAYPNIWIENDSGELVYGSVMPEMKQALQALADMYQKGQIDKEFGMKDLSNVSESLADGKIGIEFGPQWNPMYPLISSYNNDPEADWTGYPLVSADENPAYSPSAFGGSLFYAVNAECEYPEALLKLLNTHVELCWGETGDFDYYYMPEENESVGVWKFSPVTPAMPFKNLNAFIDLEAARADNSLGQLKGEAAAIQRNIEAYLNGDSSQWGWLKIYGPDGVYRHAVEYKDQNLYMWDKFTGAPTPTMSTSMNTLKQIEREVFVKIVMGSVTIDEFDRFVNDWYQVGGGDITEEVNDWYLSQP